MNNNMKELLDFKIEEVERLTARLGYMTKKAASRKRKLREMDKAVIKRNNVHQVLSRSHDLLLLETSEVHRKRAEYYALCKTQVGTISQLIQEQSELSEVYDVILSSPKEEDLLPKQQGGFIIFKYLMLILLIIAFIVSLA
jgi:hypothetical protein